MYMIINVLNSKIKDLIIKGQSLYKKWCLIWERFWIFEELISKGELGLDDNGEEIFEDYTQFSEEVNEPNYCLNCEFYGCGLHEHPDCHYEDKFYTCRVHELEDILGLNMNYSSLSLSKQDQLIKEYKQLTSK